MIEHASGGVLFLDEIGEIPLSAQAKLLRVIHNREVQRLGSPHLRRVDVRIVAATNRDLKEMVEGRTFREDLYYRLAMVEIHLPRLADRREDLPLLQRHFLRQLAERFDRPGLALSRRVQTLLARHSWPGNVRELENVLGYSAMMSRQDVIELEDLPASFRQALTALQPRSGESDRDVLPLKEVARQHVRKVLERVGGNRVKAAALLGISRATLYRLLQRA
jgi:transcriptional regulator with PAS, ATPase and Fis domain